MEPLSWTTTEFEEKNRHADWVWTAGLIFGLSAAIAFFYQNLFFGIFLCIAGACIIIFALRTPEEITITLDEKTLFINDTVITTDRISHFWIDETKKPDKLLLSVRGSFVPILVLLIENIETQKIREAFSKVCPEKQIHESLGVKIFERLGF
jgi:hypothetical protein